MTKLDINPALASHTTQIAFHLTLSKAMIGALQSIKMDHDLWKAGGYKKVSFSDRMSWEQSLVGRLPTYVAGYKALKARGLVEDIPPPKKAHWTTKPTVKLTPAGDRVWDLLIMAGVVIPFDLPANLEKKSA